MVAQSSPFRPDRQDRESRPSRCMISKVKSHAFLKETFTGSYEMLASMLKVTGHVTAYELRQFQRFASYGPWPH